MQSDIKEIEIPARADAPPTRIRVRRVYKVEAALKTAPLRIYLAWWSWC